MSNSTEPDAYVGAVLSQKWRLVRTIGQGGLGMVFEASSPGAEENVAVKVLREEFREEKMLVDRFLSEAKAGSRVKHAGIAEVFEAARAEDGTPYLVMELLRGVPLSAKMNQGPIPVAEAARILRAMLEAIEKAHSNGVVHRDLKPDNVFLEEAPGAPRVKILDLGLARVMDEAGGINRKTRTGMMLGTPGYMSPEQVKNTKDADERTDLWSAAIILYEMLTAKPAFPAANHFERVSKVMTSDPEAIDVVAPQYAHWKAFFQKGLAREPDHRFRSAGEMRAALDATAQPGSEPFLLSSSDPARAPGAGPFGSVDTAVSAAPRYEDAMPSKPLVEVVELPSRPVWARPWFVILVAVVTLGLGIAIGVLGVGG